MAGIPGSGPPPAPGADPRAVDSVMRAVALIEDRSGEVAGVEEMASAACYSPFYFSRLFARATGHSPYDYLIRRRVAMAAAEVVGGERSLIDVGADRGFEVPDTFARAFRRCFGCSPSEARRRGSYPAAVARTAVSRPYVEFLLAAGPLRPLRAEAPASVLVGSWIQGPGLRADPALPRRGGVAAVERDGGLLPLRSFSGTAAAPGEEPEFPLAATRLPGGEYARFPPVPAEELPLVVEFAYRAWLPGIGRCGPPPFDLVEEGAGGAMALLLPLGT